MGRLIAGFDHRHPALAIADQIVLECQAGGIPRADDAGNPLVLQIVLEQIPGEFMGELEALDQALLLQLAQRPLPRQLHAALQHLEGPLEIVEPLAPADIWIGHGVRLDPTLNRAIHRMMKRAVKSAMQAISANDLKTGGIGAISRALEHEREVGLSVRGELRFVVMEADAYQRLRECELEIALQEARADLAAGRVVYESVDDHLKRLDAMAIGPDDEVQTSHSQP